VPTRREGAVAWERDAAPAGRAREAGGEAERDERPRRAPAAPADASEHGGRAPDRAPEQSPSSARAAPERRPRGMRQVARRHDETTRRSAQKLAE